MQNVRAWIVAVLLLVSGAGGLGWYSPLSISVLGEEPSGVAQGAPAASESEETANLGPLIQLLGELDDAEVQSDLLTGMLQALRGRRQVTPPAEWAGVTDRLANSPSAMVRELATRLGLIFGEAKATERLLTLAQQPKAAAEERHRAVQALLDIRSPELAPVLLKLLDDSVLGMAAIRGLAAYEAPGTAEAILKRYATLDTAGRQDAVSTLAARPATAAFLLEALAEGRIPPRDVSAFTARQIQAFGDEKLSARLAEVWGTLRPTAGRKAELAVRYRELLAPQFQDTADASRGRLVFQRTCAQCHRLFDAGGDVGPNLTGSNRANLEYLLENLLDPSALIGKDFQLVTIVTVDGRLLSGIIRERRPQTLVIQTANERVVVATEDIDELLPSTVSMMPEGILDKLTETELRDLTAYLRAPEQTPLPEDREETIQGERAAGK